MNKIIHTALVAIGVAVAMVATVDAKQMKRRTTDTTTPKPQTKRERMQDANDSATILLQTSQAVEENQTLANQEELKMTIAEQADTQDKQQSVDLTTREKELLEGITLVQTRLKDLNYGWFGFRTDKETQKAYKAASARLRDLKAELADVQAQLKTNIKKTSTAWVNAVKYSIGVLSAAALVAIGYDLYSGRGNVMGAYQSAKGTLQRGFAQLPSIGSNATAQKLAQERAFVSLQLEEQNQILRNIASEERAINASLKNQSKPLGTTVQQYYRNKLNK